MLELIATIILLVGLIGMAIIIFQKIPVLTELLTQEVEKPGVLDRLKHKIRNNGTIKSFSPLLLLQRILSGIRVLILRTEKKLRQKSIENKFSDDYWKRIRKEK
ncbi:hypothetical protein KJA13_02620 [Patescibacteria group bacterium]|nr:hypothetical protein [Patescibacteria group bacterium]